MKRKPAKQNLYADYGQLRRKIFMQMVLLLFASLLCVLLLYMLASGRFADLVVGLLQQVFNLDFNDASNVYHYVIRNNWFVIMILTSIFFFMIFCWFSLSWFTRYFSEINKGIDALLDEEKDSAHLSPEMSFMEKKLRTVKETLKRRTLEARYAEQKKNDLVMYLAHDIRTPLTSVIGYLSLLDEAPEMPPELKAKYTHITLDKAYRLEELINEFFEITRYNLHTMPIETSDIDLTYMLAQLTDEFFPMLSADDKKITVSGDETITITGDANKLARVFNNILKNAISYSNPNSTIEVSVAKRADHAIISFTNTGQTIPPQKQAALFDKFYRLDEARSSHTGGAGLGLSIAKEIVTMHHGTITMSSDNNLTVFTVELPCYD